MCTRMRATARFNSIKLRKIRDNSESINPRKHARARANKKERKKERKKAQESGPIKEKDRATSSERTRGGERRREEKESAEKK